MPNFTNKNKELRIFNQKINNQRCGGSRPSDDPTSRWWLQTGRRWWDFYGFFIHLGRPWGFNQVGFGEWPVPKTRWVQSTRWVWWVWQIPGTQIQTQSWMDTLICQSFCDFNVGICILVVLRFSWGYLLKSYKHMRINLWLAKCLDVQINIYFDWQHILGISHIFLISNFNGYLRFAI